MFTYDLCPVPVDVAQDVIRRYALDERRTMSRRAFEAGIAPALRRRSATFAALSIGADAHGEIVAVYATVGALSSRPDWRRGPRTASAELSADVLTASATTNDRPTAWCAGATLDDQYTSHGGNQ